jgi:hypothetical protein
MLTVLALVAATACICILILYCLVEARIEIYDNLMLYDSVSQAGPDVLNLATIICLTIFHPGVAFEA